MSCIFEESHCIMEPGMRVDRHAEVHAPVSRLTAFVSPFYVRTMCRRLLSWLYRSTADTDSDMRGRRLHVGL